MDPHLFQTLSGVVFLVFALVVFAGLSLVFGAETRHGFGEDVNAPRRGDWI